MRVKMIKLKMVSLIVASILFFTCSSACSEEDIFSVSDEFLALASDLSEKESVVMSSSGYPESIFIISFDFTDGNQTIIAIAGEKCKVYYFFEDNELMSVLFQMILHFTEIESQIPEGHSLQYEIRFSETEIHHITPETISKYYSWTNQR